MASYSELVATIFNETIACQDPASPQSQHWRTGRYAPLGFDIIGPDGGFPTTDLAMEALADIADRFRENDATLFRTTARAAIRLLASRASGDVFQQLAHEPDRTKHWPILRDRLRDLAARISADLVHYILCGYS